RLWASARNGFCRPAAFREANYERRKHRSRRRTTSPTRSLRCRLRDQLACGSLATARTPRASARRASTAFSTVYLGWSWSFLLVAGVRPVRSPYPLTLEPWKWALPTPTFQVERV